MYCTFSRTRCPLHRMGSTVWVRYFSEFSHLFNLCRVQPFSSHHLSTRIAPDVIYDSLSTSTVNSCLVVHVIKLQSLSLGSFNVHTVMQNRQQACPALTMDKDD